MTAGERAWLVLDTSTPIAVVGVVRARLALSEHRVSEPRRHAEGIIDAIDSALLAASVALEDIAGIGVGVGPGSFIGVRTGIATAKGLCLGRSIPLVGLPTLVAIAHSLELPQGRGMVVVDAKRHEVYAQLVESAAGQVRALAVPCALSPDEARVRAASLAFVVGTALGDAAHIPVASPSAVGLARVLAELIAHNVSDELATLAPDYCRPPDAKLPSVDPGAHRPREG